MFNKNVNPSGPGAKNLHARHPFYDSITTAHKCFPGLAAGHRILNRSDRTISAEPLHNHTGSRTSFKLYVDILRRVY